jgi:hypothetical protein
MAYEEKEKEGKGRHQSPWSHLLLFGIVERTVTG